MSEDLERTIREALTIRFAKIVDEEVERAKSILAERLNEHVATTAMTVAKFYEVHRMQDRVVITVRDGGTTA